MKPRPDTLARDDFPQKLLVTLVLVLWLLPTVTISQTAILLDHVDGSFQPGTITTTGPVTFYLRFQNSNPYGTPLLGATNSFRIYTTNNAQWSVPEVFEVIDISEYFDLLHSVDYYDADGLGVDTLSFAFTRMNQPGLPYGFDDVTHGITITPSAATVGRMICLDSVVIISPTGVWLWSYGAEHNSIRPDWDGPHCFVLDDSPCCQQRGNIDHDPDQTVDIADLIYLVLYMFNDGPPPICLEEANIDGDPTGEPNIADMVHLVAWMFDEGDPPVPCD